MIDKLSLTNFQAHKKSELEFCPGVNAIIGESDEGKTSIIRALYWASQNKPSGGDFISDFSKRGECSSTIVVEGNEVTRFKNKTKNEYRVNNQPFKALGKGGIPEEVHKVIDLTELNFQNQMDSPFLLSNNGGEVARYLNDIVNLNVIDESLKKINSKVNACAQQIKGKEAEMVENEKELEMLNWISLAEQELQQLEDDYYECKEAESKQEYLIDTLEECDDLVEKLERFRDHDQEEYEIRLLLEEYKCYKTGLDIFDEFKSDLNSVKAIKTRIDSLPLNKKEIESIVSLHSLIDTFIVKEDKILHFDHLLGDVEDYQQQIKTKNLDIQELESEFKRDFPDICPLC